MCKYVQIRALQIRSWSHGLPICGEQWARHSWRFDEHASSDVAFNGVTTIHKLHKGEVNVERKVCLGVKLQQSTVVYSFSFRPLNIKIFQKYFSLCHWISKIYLNRWFFHRLHQWATSPPWFLINVSFLKRKKTQQQSIDMCDCVLLMPKMMMIMMMIRNPMTMANQCDWWVDEENVMILPFMMRVMMTKTMMIRNPVTIANQCDRKAGRL